MAGKIKFMTATKRKFDSHRNRYYELWTAQNEPQKIPKFLFVFFFFSVEIYLNFSNFQHQSENCERTNSCGTIIQVETDWILSQRYPHSHNLGQRIGWRWRHCISRDDGTHILKLKGRRGRKRKHDKLLLIFRSIFSRNVITFFLTMMEFSFSFTTSTIFLFKLLFCLPL